MTATFMRSCFFRMISRNLRWAITVWNGTMNQTVMNRSGHMKQTILKTTIATVALSAFASLDVHAKTTIQKAASSKAMILKNKLVDKETHQVLKGFYTY